LDKRFDTKERARRLSDLYLIERKIRQLTHITPARLEKNLQVRAGRSGQQES